MTPEFWTGKRVLVTGHTGFKGAWLVQLLHRLGAEVAGIALPPEVPSLHAQAGISQLLVQEEFVDLAAEGAAQRMVEGFAPEIVFHLAAQSVVRRAYRDPLETFASNVMATARLMEALRSCETLRTVLVTTTDKVYYNDERGVPFREGDRLGSTEPYAASKAATEFVLATWRKTYLAPRGVSVLSARAGNVLGGGDWTEANLVPDAIRAALQGQPLVIRSPASVRPWQFVLDVLAGYVTLVERKGDQREARDPEDLAWNFGPGPDSGFVTVAQICTWMQAFWPQRFSWRHEPDPHGIAESKLLLIDPSRAQRDLGWEIRYAPKEALRRTVAWYAAHMDGADARQLCAQEIDAFLSPASPA